MALRRSGTIDRPARALTAAAIRLDPKDRERARKETRKRPLPWQKTAFEFYDSLGEAHFAATWVGEACSRISLQPAYASSMGERPSPIDSEAAAADAGATAEEYQAVQAALSRLSGGEGGEAEIMRAAAVNLFVAGEGNLIGRKDDDNPEVERWEIVSVEALTTDAQGRYAIKPSPSAKRDEFIALEDDAFVLRIMRRHPRYPDWPDSAMRGALDYCEDLRVLSGAIRAAATSRIPAGILGVPENMTFGSTTAEDETDPDEDPFMKKLMEHMTTPLMDPQSASALVPILVRGNADDIDKIRPIELSRGIDDLAVQLREETRRAFATSIDLPAEILVGLSTANHWSAWAITDEAYRIHIEPYALGIADALTFGYLRPAIEELVLEPALWSIATEPSGLVSSPDESRDVQDAYDRAEVTGAYYRQVRGIPEDAAPDEEELARRKELKTIIGPTPPTGTPAPPGGNGGVVGGQPNAVEEGPPPSEVTAAAVPDAEIVLEPMQLEAGPDPFDGVGMRLARAEIALRQRVRFVADETLRRALERAGNRLRTLAQRDKTGLVRRVVDDVPAPLVASTLGAAIVAGLETDIDDLLLGAWDTLEARWNEIVGQAQREARRYCVGLGVAAGVMPEGSLDALIAAGILDDGAFEAKAAELRAVGFAVLTEGLAATAAERLFSPTVPVPEKGEFDATALVSPRLVRAALREAGGGALTAAAGEATLGGVFSGPQLQDMLGQAARAVFGKGFEWVYGDEGSRKVAFTPHSDLDGKRFTGMTDEVLATDGVTDEKGNDANWVGDYFWPDDHDGCQCEVARVVERGGEEQLITAVSSEARMAMETSAIEDRVNAVLSVDRMTMHDMATWASERGWGQGGSLYAALEAAGLDEATIGMTAQHIDALAQQFPSIASQLQEFQLSRMPGTYAKVGIRADTMKSSLVVNSQPTEWAMLAEDVRVGWSTNLDARATITHELGHVSHNAAFVDWAERTNTGAGGVRGMIEQFDRESRRVARDVFARTGGSPREAAAKILGEYVNDGGAEIFAQAFATLHAPPDSLVPISDGARALVEEYAAKMNAWAAKVGYEGKII